MKINRRIFVIQSVAGVVAASALSAVQAQTLVPLKDTDAPAAALGYKADGTKVDKAKYPKFAGGQVCSNCALYQGKAGDVGGACPLFAGKQVAAEGWCSAYAKKA